MNNSNAKSPVKRATTTDGRRHERLVRLLGRLKPDDYVWWCSPGKMREMVEVSRVTVQRICIASKSLSFDKQGLQIGGLGKHWLEPLEPNAGDVQRPSKT